MTCGFAYAVDPGYFIYFGRAALDEPLDGEILQQIPL